MDDAGMMDSVWRPWMVRYQDVPVPSVQFVGASTQGDLGARRAPDPAISIAAVTAAASACIRATPYDKRIE
jgi:hypothetical protein